MVRLLVDESTGRKLALMLADDGHDTLYVADWKPQATDAEVMEKAYEESRIIITDDKDFGELVFRFGKVSKGIILIRTSSTDPYKRFLLLSKLLKSIDVKNKFVVLRDEAVKVTKLG
jgi:predicted nuclease of predicted toxin-antitoxin system